MKRAALALLLAGCGDDLSLPFPELRPYVRDLVAGGDSVYFHCDYDGARVCARRGTEPSRDVTSTEYRSALLTGPGGRATLAYPVVVDADTEVTEVAQIDPRTDEVTVLARVPGSMPGAVFRAGDRVAVLDELLWSISATGDVVEVPLAIDGPTTIVEGPDAAYFVGEDELWRTDGTLAGTVELPGFDDIDAFAPRAGGAIVLGERDGVSAVWLATATGTTRLIDIEGPQPPRVLCPTLVTAGQRLIATDGTVAGTHVVGTARFAAFGPSVQVGDACYFTGADVTGPLGRTSLWRVGPGADAVRVRDLPGLDTSAPMIAFGDHLLFRATDEAGDEPWISDGTASGTHRAWDLSLGPNGSAMQEPVVAGDTLHFLADVAGIPIDLGYEDESCALGGWCESLCAVPFD